MPFSLFRRVRGRHESPQVWPARLRLRPRRLAPVLALGLAVMWAAGCQRLHPTDTRPLDQVGMWYESVQQLRDLKISDAEVAQLAQVRQAGLSDQACVELVRTARGRKEPFNDGEAIAGLLQAGASEPTVLALARLNQLGLWSGEAQAIRLTGLSDQVVLAMARRRAAGQPVPSGTALAKLKNTEVPEAEILQLINKGINDQQAEAYAAARQRALAPRGFVRQPRRRRH